MDDVWGLLRVMSRDILFVLRSFRGVDLSGSCECLFPGASDCTDLVSYCCYITASSPGKAHETTFQQQTLLFVCIASLYGGMKSYLAQSLEVK
jgi:hypothetical protein